MSHRVRPGGKILNVADRAIPLNLQPAQLTGPRKADCHCIRNSTSPSAKSIFAVHDLSTHIGSIEIPLQVSVAPGAAFDQDSVACVRARGGRTIWLRPFLCLSAVPDEPVRYWSDYCAPNQAQGEAAIATTAEFQSSRTEVRGSHGIWPYLALGAGIVCIGWSAIFVRWTDMPGPASAFYRMLIPAVVLLPTWLWNRNSPRVSRQTLAIIAVGGLFFALDLALYNTGILRTSAGNATLLGNQTPIFVGLLSWLAFGKRPAISFWLGLVLALAGSLVIVWADIGRHVQFGAGDWMALGAAACFAVYLMATERVRTTTSTLAFLRLAIMAGAIFLFIMNLGMGVSLKIPPGRSFGALVGLGLVSQLGGYLALTYALGHLPATVTAVSLLAQGPLTALLAAWLLAEPLTVSMLTGGVLVLLGVGLANRGRDPAEEANATIPEA